MTRTPAHPGGAAHARRGGARRRAFTLVETIAAISIIAFIAAVTTTVLWTAIDATARGGVHAELHTTISTAAEQVVRHLRNIPKRSNAPGPDIASVTPTSITWSTNTTLSLSGSDLQLSIAGGTTRTLLTNVTAFELQAYDDANTALAGSLSGAACDSIRRLRVRFEASRGDSTEVVRVKVFIRSLIAGT